MLVLTRKVGEKIFIGDDIVVSVVQVNGNKVRLSIEAPESVRILRSELATWHDEPATECVRHDQSEPQPSLVFHG